MLHAVSIALAALCVLGSVEASPALVVEERGICDVAKPAIDLLKSYDANGVSFFCTSFLGYPTKASTATTTVTATSTKEKTTGTTTVTISATITRTNTYTLTEYSAVATKYKTKGVDTTTDQSFSFVWSTVTSSYGAAAVNRRAASTGKLSVDSQGKVLGLVTSLVSEACSCIATKPAPATSRKTVTATVTTNVKATKTKTVTETVQDGVFTAKTLPYTITYTVPSKTVTSSETFTISYTATICAGTNPSPNFKLQAVPLTPTQTDSFANTYATSAPEARPPTDNPPLINLDLTPSLAAASLYNIDCVGRLYTQTTPLYATIDQYTDFTIVRMMPQEWILRQGSSYLFITCQRSSDGGGQWLDCGVDSNFGGRQDKWQTCPLYEEYFDTPIAVGREYDILVDPCQGFRWRVVPA